MVAFVSKLPPSSSSIERALEQVFWEEIQLIERDIRSFLNPWECRVDLLPYLAWELSVDDWDDRWDESIKRGVCANALTVHIYKGTRGGVKAALDALGVRTDLVEWFEANPPLKQGRFKVTAWVNKNLSPGQEAFLNEDLYNRIKSAINNAKNTRSHFDFTVAAQLGPNTVRVGSVISETAALARVDSVAIQEPLTTEVGIGVAMTGQTTAVARVNANVIVDAQPEPTPIYVAAAVQGWAVLRVTMEVAA